MAFDFDLFVIGGGSGGVRCARIAAGHGARVGIAEERHWGGTCVNIGCVPKKLMVQAGEYGEWAEDAAGFGWSTTKGRHDWAAFMRRKDAEIARLSATYRRLLDNAGARIFDARATLADAHTVAVGGERFSAERIVIATGGAPTRLPIPGAELGIVSDDVFFLKEMPRRVAIIGSGYIAVEFAGIFAALGAAVDLVFRQPQPLRGFDADLREALGAALAGQGITLHPRTTPVRITREGTELALELSTQATLATDCVFFATGRAPATHGLGLQGVGVACGRHGAILVDEDKRTSIPHIFALGDVTDRVNLTPVATAEGHALADTLFGNRPRRPEYSNIPTAVFTTPPVATVGLTEEEAARAGPADIYVTRFTPMRHALTRRKRQTMMKLVVCQRTQRVLGAHMLGEDAPEIVQGLAIAINAGATKADFDRTIGIHPTAAEEFVTLRTRTRVAGAVTEPV